MFMRRFTLSVMGEADQLAGVPLRIRPKLLYAGIAAEGNGLATVLHCDRSVGHFQGHHRAHLIDRSLGARRAATPPQAKRYTPPLPLETGAANVGSELLAC